MTFIPKRQRRLHRPALKTLLAGVDSKAARNEALARAYLRHGYTLAEIGRAGGVALRHGQPHHQGNGGNLIIQDVTPVLFGAGVALALIGWIWTGLAVIVLGSMLPRLIKRSAPHFLLTQALQDAQFYRDLVAAAVLKSEV